MKLLRLSLIVAFQMSAFAPQADCQDNKTEPEQLHITIGAKDGRVVIAASNMSRDLSSKESSSILHLKGNVEIKLITCIPSGQPGDMVCAGSMALHADEADYNEKTGDIQTRGNVRIVQRPAI